MTDTTPTPQPLDLDALLGELEEVADLGDDPSGRSLAVRAGGALEDLRTERDGLAAQVERMHGLATHGDPESAYVQLDRIAAIASAAPSDALAEVKREAAAEALDDASEMVPPGIGAQGPWLRELAAATRKGRS